MQYKYIKHFRNSPKVFERKDLIAGNRVYNYSQTHSKIDMEMYGAGILIQIKENSIYLIHFKTEINPGR